MDGLTALLIYASAETSGRLAHALEALGVSCSAIADPDEAAAALRTERYGAVVLDDALPGGGSLRVFDALDELGDRRPAVLMVSVPRDVLGAMRQNATDRIEYVPTPESEADAGRLATRIRGRLVSAGVAEEFGAGPNAFGTRAGSGVLVAPAGPANRPYAAIVAVLIILLGLFLFLRQIPDVPVGAVLPFLLPAP